MTCRSAWLYIRNSRRCDFCNEHLKTHTHTYYLLAWMVNTYLWLISFRFICKKKCNNTYNCSGFNVSFNVFNLLTWCIHEIQQWSNKTTTYENIHLPDSRGRCAEPELSTTDTLGHNDPDHTDPRRRKSEHYTILTLSTQQREHCCIEQLCCSCVTYLMSHFAFKGWNVISGITVATTQSIFIINVFSSLQPLFHETTRGKVKKK